MIDGRDSCDTWNILSSSINYTTGWTFCSAHASILGPCMYQNQGKWYKSSYLNMGNFLLRLFDL